MPARTLPLRTSLLVLLSELVYNLDRLRTSPFGTPFVPLFESLRADWNGVLAQELSLREAHTLAQAMVDAADDGLDDFCAAHSKVVLTLTKDSTKHPLWELFYGKKTLAQFKRPVLGGQFDTMSAWVGLLEKSEHPSLSALAAELIALVKTASEAIAARDKADQENRLFRAVGARKQWIDKLNAARKETFGALDKLPHEQPGLPTDFASRFFRPASAAADGELPTIASVKAQMAQLQAELADQAALLLDLEAAAAKDAETEKQLEADRAALAEAEKAAAEATQKASILKAKLGRRR